MSEQWSIPQNAVAEIVSAYWLRFYCTEHCTLCGNAGIVDSRGVSTPAGVAVGRLNWCICPNGHVLRAVTKQQTGRDLPTEDELRFHQGAPQEVSVTTGSGRGAAVTVTPGQVAYEAFVSYRHLQVPMFPWRSLLPPVQAGWEAAAQAVLDETPGFQFALGQQVRRSIDPENVWVIWWRSRREELAQTFFDFGLKLVDPARDDHPCAMTDGSDLSLAEDTP